jgi:aminoglycoside N3'-acetyltransferase
LKKTLSQCDIVDGLKMLGLEPGMAIEVHSSLSRFGPVEGGAPTVINALIEAVGEQGAIVMTADLISPLLPLTEEDKARGIYAKVRLLDENADCKSGMGVIADTFRKRPNTCLGKGVHRVCAWGRDAELHSQGFKYLLSIDGWALLIGVDINRCSSMHIAEETVKLPREIYAHFELPEAIQQELDRAYPDSEGWYVQYNGPHAPVADDAWGKVVLEAERRGLIRRGQIGQAECMLFKVKSVVNIFEDFRRTDPFKLFGIEKKSQ